MKPKTVLVATKTETISLFLLKSSCEVKLPHGNRPLENRHLADLAASDDVHEELKLIPVLISIFELKHLGGFDPASSRDRSHFPARKWGTGTRKRTRFRQDSGFVRKVFVVA